ncbi:lysylphosphatidylglycerol synthase domain-containing protein [Bosea sp. CS1GBMeth4]|uniref:lysylphosphatidylglycerol synthase domain-containing protein n=1 Tax=Bosea sp. CS1GBMeth4 TaxID=1892849 RepID=UPI0016473538|nr:lysylphosphatidylglycerol synthase domain-containing protein [Bosea sp. CS1GBMeth4]
MDLDASRDGSGGGAKRWPSVLRTLLALAAIALAAYLLHRTLRGHSYDELVRLLRSAAPARVAAALGFALSSYACLTLFDALALRYAGRPLPYRQAALASFTSLSLGHNIGLAALSSGAIRYHFYARWGLSVGEVARVILFCGATVGIGLGTLAALALLLRTDLAAKLTGLPESALLALAAGLILMLAAYLVACVVVRGRWRIRNWGVELPDPRLAAAQFVVGPLNFALVAASLHQALASLGTVSYPDVAASYVLANIASLIAHVPGGLGVIEAVVATVLPGAGVVAGLLIFRAVYFLVPLLPGAALLAFSLLRGRREQEASGSA